MNLNDKEFLLTAYALGELEGEQLKEIEALIQNNPELKAFVEDVKLTSNILRQELCEKEQSFKLSDKQKGFVLEQKSIQTTSSFWNNVKLPIFGLVTAGFAGVVIINLFMDRSGNLMLPSFRVENRVITKTDSQQQETSVASDSNEIQQVVDRIRPNPGLKRLGQFRRANFGGGLNPNYQASNDSFQAVKAQPLSTFDMDVKTASYADVRRALKKGRLPEKDRVHVEELLNYFSYSDPQPEGQHPFGIQVEVSDAPWNPDHKLARVGLRGRPIQINQKKAANLVFLIHLEKNDQDEFKVAVLQDAMKTLVESLGAQDRIAFVDFADNGRVVLNSTSAVEKLEVLSAIDNLQSDSEPRTESGLELAYRTVRENMINNGNNRVVLITDRALAKNKAWTKLVSEQSDVGIGFTVIDFSWGPEPDEQLKQLTEQGKGNYVKVDSLHSARKMFLEQINGSIYTIAKNVKLRIEFNPQHVGAYRLLGFENRYVQKAKGTEKDGDEIGAGLRVTAMYEIIPSGQELTESERLRYQVNKPLGPKHQNELMNVSIRYRAPNEPKPRYAELIVPIDTMKPWKESSPDFKFASAVAGFGMKLKGKQPKGGNLDWPNMIRWAREGSKQDPNGYRKDFINMMEKASKIQRANYTE